MRVARFKPVGVEVKERNDKNGEEKRAVDAWPIQDVGSGDEEDEIDW
jgi:hypothetical protein